MDKAPWDFLPSESHTAVKQEQIVAINFNYDYSLDV